MSGNRETPANLPLMPMGWGSSSIDFEGAEDFWQEVQRITADSSLGGCLDQAMAGKSAPRIWLFLHVPGQGALSAAAALEMARELGSRDQAVLILDGDDQDSGLTRWVGRHEKEGWIDLVRYGASVLTAGSGLPFSGRRGYVLGVGSFTPTDVEPQEAEDLINRLKRQADDLLVVAPADQLGQLWAKLADIRLLCWDRSHTEAGDVAFTAHRFSDSGVALTGLVGFGLADSGMGFDPAPEAEFADPEEAPEESPEESSIHTRDDSPVEVAASGLTSGHEDSPGEQSDEEAVETISQPGEEVAKERGSGSSRVFWFAALVSLALIVVVAVYYLRYVREDSVPPGGSPIVAESSPTQNVPANQAETSDMAQETGPVHPARDLMASRDSLQETEVAENLQDQGTGAGSVPEEGTPLGEPGESGSGDIVPAADDSSLAKDEAKSEQDLAEVTQPVTAPAKPNFAMDPYLQNVGTDGWAMHLFSLPDSLSAHEEALRLERRGFQTATRPFVIKDKGRWYRVYVGSFISRQEALEAKGPLLERLKLDWARVTEF